MLKRACAVLLGLSLILATGTFRTAAASDEQPEPPAVWKVLRQFEEEALRDYAHHVVSSDVQQRGQLLWTLSRSPDFLRQRNSCGAAARTLSYMITAFYDSAQRLEVALDWYEYAPVYISRRAACLAELSIDPQQYPLPRWFGR